MKVSIIIPVYKVEQFIIKCLQSVVNQTMTEGIECIIVDDKGNDNSIHLAENFVCNYRGKIFFKIIKRESNGGLSAARNAGIRVASGDYLYFLDSDDELLPSCMESMHSLIEKYGDVDLVQGMFVEEPNRLKYRPEYEIPEYTKDASIIKHFLLTYRGDIIPAQTRLVHRDFFISNDLFFKEGIIHEDNYWTFFLAKKVKSMAYCKERNYFHRHNPASITHDINVEKEIFAYRTILEAFCNNIDSFMSGRQKELIMNTLITCVDRKFYENESDKSHLIKLFKDKNTMFQKAFVDLYFSANNKFIRNKSYWVLLHLYRLSDK